MTKPYAPTACGHHTLRGGQWRLVEKCSSQWLIFTHLMTITVSIYNKRISRSQNQGRVLLQVNMWDCTKRLFVSLRVPMLPRASLKTSDPPVHASLRATQGFGEDVDPLSTLCLWTTPPSPSDLGCTGVFQHIAPYSLFSLSPPHLWF